MLQQDFELQQLYLMQQQHHQKQQQEEQKQWQQQQQHATLKLGSNLQHKENST